MRRKTRNIVACNEYHWIICFALPISQQQSVSVCDCFPFSMVSKFWVFLKDLLTDGKQVEVIAIMNKHSWPLWYNSPTVKKRNSRVMSGTFYVRPFCQSGLRLSWLELTFPARKRAVASRFLWCWDLQMRGLVWVCDVGWWNYQMKPWWKHHFEKRKETKYIIRNHRVVVEEILPAWVSKVVNSYSCRIQCMVYLPVIQHDRQDNQPVAGTVDVFLLLEKGMFSSKSCHIAVRIESTQPFIPHVSGLFLCYDPKYVIFPQRGTTTHPQKNGFQLFHPLIRHGQGCICCELWPATGRWQSCEGNWRQKVLGTACGYIHDTHTL